MIERINKLSSIGRFTEFTWSDDVQGFLKYNFIFGENGSGKTTLSNVLRLFSVVDRAADLYGELASNAGSAVEVTIDGNLVTFAEGCQTQRLYAFNAEFVADHVFDGSTLNCRQFAGAVVTEKQLANPKIKELEATLSRLRQEKVAKEDRQSHLQESFDAIKRKLSTDLNSRIQGTRAPSMSVPDVVPADSHETYTTQLSAAYREHDRAQAQRTLAEDQTKVRNLEFATLTSDVSTIERLLSTSVAADARQRVQAHIDSIGAQDLRYSTVRDWLEDGFTLLKSAGRAKEQICPLCRSGLKGRLTELIADYDAFFSKAFADLIDGISEALKTIDGDLEVLSTNEASVRALQAIADKNNTLLGSSALNRPAAQEIESEVMTGDTHAAKRLLEQLRSLLEQKRDDVDNQNLDVQATAKSLINEYNHTVEGDIERRDGLAKRLSPGLRTPSEILSDIRALVVKSAAAGFNEGGKGEQIEDYLGVRNRLSEIDQSISETDEARSAEISRLRSEAQYVNRYLRALGIQHFDLVMGDNAGEGIHIRFRGGVVKRQLKHSLSESEKTALALSYFISKVRYEVVDASGVELGETTVVIDDPVSSLDDGRLHGTARLLWAEFSGCAQLFVLSHNLLFMRFLSNLLGNARAQNENGERVPCRGDYYLGRYASTIIELPEELSNYRTPYFRRLADLAAYSEGTIPHETAKLFAPNHIRTTLEAFLSFKFHVLKEGSSGQKYRSAGLEKLIGTLQAKRHTWSDLPAVNEINAESLIDTLIGIKRITDSQSHGSPIDVDHVSFVSEEELRHSVKDTLDVIRFLDRIHATEAFG